MPLHLIVAPTSDQPTARAASPAAIADLTGRTVGFLSNSKMNADIVLEGVAAALVDRFGIKPHLYVKRVPSIGAEPELLDRIARECDAAVVAMLDCGSCASWSCADMVELARRQLAICGMASDQFDAFSRQVLEMKGASDLGLSVIAHPVVEDTGAGDYLRWAPPSYEGADVLVESFRPDDG